MLCFIESIIDYSIGCVVEIISILSFTLEWIIIFGVMYARSYVWLWIWFETYTKAMIWQRLSTNTKEVYYVFVIQYSTQCFREQCIGNTVVLNLWELCDGMKSESFLILLHIRECRVHVLALLALSMGFIPPTNLPMYVRFGEVLL